MLDLKKSKYPAIICTVFSFTHDFDLANEPPVPNQRKFKILNHSNYSLSILL